MTQKKAPQLKTTNARIRKKILAVLDTAGARPDTQRGPHRCGMIHRTALVLATSYKDNPRATALEFFHEGLTLYSLGGPGGKIANIRRNPRVSAFIYQQPMDHHVVQCSLQIFGTAELMTHRNNRRAFLSRLKKWNLSTVMNNLLQPLVKEKNLTGKDAENFIRKCIEANSFIKITPDHIILKEYHPDFSMKKYEWKKER
jgi:nitroimidazol reductase NimA-like FMN-containing flavoprotein (pyridoxamine 5'-phosphate oxidase superfamily)